MEWGGGASADPGRDAGLVTGGRHDGPEPVDVGVGARRQ